MRIAIIGGGAAGFFSALSVKENYSESEVVIFEKSKRTLSKVKISGGGRCNVTNGCFKVSELCKAYPRGGKKLRKAFKLFNTRDTMNWFESRNVPLVIQQDACVFPQSQNSQTVIDCFVNEARKNRIKIQLSSGVESIENHNGQLKISFGKPELQPLYFDKVIICTGGSPKSSGLEWVKTLGHTIVDPVPSLFTFNMPSEPVKKLMGIVVEKTMVSVPGTKLKSDGPLLITHWGMSGPAILKLSSFGARILSELNYDFEILVNWVNEKNKNLVKEQLISISNEHSKKKIINYRPYTGISNRLWEYLIDRVKISNERMWGELGSKSHNKLKDILTNDRYKVSGKTTFKEEFVTCGGVSLDDIDMNTMQSKIIPQLYFAGEVMDIDAITGGYNFQAAWTTGFIAGKLQ